MAKRNKSGPGAPKMESLMKSPLGDAIAQASPRIQPSTTERAVPVNPGSDKFDATKHLSYVPPKEIKTMKDLGYPNDLGVSPVAVSQPFQLFTEEAVDVMRKEIFQKGVQENCTFSSNLAARQLRGYTKEYAPFAYDAWTDPKVLSIISEIAGINLVPVNDYEIAHINYSFKSETQVKEERRHMRQMSLEDEGISGCHESREEKPVVGWHKDAYAFVCVLMMSDCTNMVGGETAVRTADGKYIKVRGPTKGCAVILQGRYLYHEAMRALGAQERITSVTSFRPKSPFVKDDTVLRTVRPVSNLNGLYSGYAEYRLELMLARIQRELEGVTGRDRAGLPFDTRGHKQFLQDIGTFAKQTDDEIVEDVRKGFIEETGFADAKIDSDKEPNDIESK